MTLFHKAAPLLVLTTCSFICTPAEAQNDHGFRPRISHPAYTANGPRVLVDEGHWNAFTLEEGRGSALHDLLRADGYRVAAISSAFTPSALEAADILIVAAARGLDWNTLESSSGGTPDSAVMFSAFTHAEIEDVRAWVDGGGGLLIAAEHFPYAHTMAALAMVFGVELRDGILADTANLHVASLPDSFPSGTPMDGRILASRENELLRPHSITRGRAPAEEVASVVFFGGTSLCGPASSHTLVTLSRTAEQRPLGPFPQPQPQRGCAQAIAFPHGNGRVVVLGDANGFVTAQERDLGTKRVKVGLSMEDADNQQFLLNTVRWLSKLLP
ncbi:hypothetical protein BH23GEM9_BH23GEM9_15920 [soil metagenome]